MLSATILLYLLTNGPDSKDKCPEYTFYVEETDKCVPFRNDIQYNNWYNVGNANNTTREPSGRDS